MKLLWTWLFLMQKYSIGTEFVALVKMPNLAAFDKLTAAQNEFAQNFLWILKLFLINFAIFKYLQTYIWEVYILCSCASPVHILCSCARAFPTKEGGMQMLTGLAQFSQAVGSLLRTSGWQSRAKIFSNKRVQQIHFNVKLHSTTFDQMTDIFVIKDLLTRRDQNLNCFV